MSFQTDINLHSLHLISQLIMLIAAFLHKIKSKELILMSKFSHSMRNHSASQPNMKINVGSCLCIKVLSKIVNKPADHLLIYDQPEKFISPEKFVSNVCWLRQTTKRLWRINHNIYQELGIYLCKKGFSVDVHEDNRNSSRLRCSKPSICSRKGVL